MKRGPCRGKRRFVDKVSAELDLLRIKQKKGHLRANEPIRSYQCPVCKGYHLTSREYSSIG